MSHKPVPVLFMSVMLVFVLASAGVAYGLWTGSTLISGVVGTGGISIEWDPATVHCLYDNVPVTIWTIDPANPTLVELEVQDAVPGVTDTCYFTLKNMGTFDVTIVEENVTGEVPGELTINFSNGLNRTLKPCPDPDCQETATLEYMVEQGAQQNHTYEFTVEIVAQQ